MTAEKIEQGYLKAKNAIEKMKKSRLLNYVSQKVKISHKLTLEIRCERLQEGECHPDYVGTACCFEVLALVNGEEVDSCTDHWSIDEDIKYLIKCWG